MAQAVNLPPQKRKPYVPPVFTVYGTVRELTQKQGHSGQSDHGSPLGLNKTHIG
jgi:hypothetical protein